MHARGFWCALVVAVGDVAEAAPVVPNDPLFPQQVHLTQIAAPEAWATTTGSRTVRVAIVATGIDLTHPDLVANLWTNPGEIPANGIDDDGNGYIDDVHGWDFADDTNNLQDEPGIGTHLAGIIGAAGNNGIGIAGVCHEVTLIPVRVQQSWIPAASIVDAVPAGIRYAVALGADVVLLGIPPAVGG